MKIRLLRVTLALVWLAMLAARPLRAESCKDEEAMLDDAKKSVVEIVDTVRKESLEDFQNKYHQKNALSKLSFLLLMVDQAVSCYQKASQDAAAPKDQVEAYKAKQEAYAKLKAKLQAERDALKSTEDPKNAKELVAKLDVST